VIKIWVNYFDFFILNTHSFMRPEDLLTEAFLKQFKSREDLNNFLGQLQKRGIEKMLEGELDGLLAMRSMANPITVMPVMAMERKRSEQVLASHRSWCHATAMPASTP
jgi:hypothetical protein